MWIETDDYVGLERRGGRRFRLLDRRRERSNHGQTPSLRTLVRQLRMIDLSLASPPQQRNFRLRLEAAATLAAKRAEYDISTPLTRIMAAFDSAEDARSISNFVTTMLDRLAERLA